VVVVTSAEKRQSSEAELTAIFRKRVLLDLIAVSDAWFVYEIKQAANYELS